MMFAGFHFRPWEFLAICGLLLVLVMAPFVIAAALGFRHLARNVTRQSARAMGEVNKAIQEARLTQRPIFLEFRCAP